jgi:hypothetical protein
MHAASGHVPASCMSTRHARWPPPADAARERTVSGQVFFGTLPN